MPSRGELEQRVMELLWAAKESLTVADVQTALLAERELAYTTVMTVLDRLAKKGLADRKRSERAWQYRAASSQVTVVTADLIEQLADVPSRVRIDALQQVLAKLSPTERTELYAAFCTNATSS